MSAIKVCWLFAVAMTALTTFVTYKAYGHDIATVIPPALLFLGGSMGFVHWWTKD